MTVEATSTREELGGIAVVGMAGRFPAAADVGEFWSNLCAGRECLTRLGADELLASGVERAAFEDPRYVPVNGLLADADLFDADFFRMSPREAAVTDPQHRVFLELAWRALEHAGYDPASYAGAIGVYAGCGMSGYLLHNLLPNRAELASFGELRARMGNGQEYLATRVSYKLDLRGPSVSVNTACSTSLVAAHLACEALLNYQCDMALAGGVSIQLPQGRGYFHEDGGILSPDGRCRAFDAAARGTVSGNGGAVVLLKRLADALEDGDTVYAVVRGTAVNNDGADKSGYTAPSVAGQARVIAEAQDVAGVEAETIGYVEAHGTGTPLGDPIEFAALTEVFRRQTAREQFCALGSVKTNLGHLDEAAGVAGLIKTVLMLHHRRLVPSLHFESPNPEMDYAGGPFFVNTELREWPAPQGDTPRRAAVSSFGIGGTNAHVVLEEAPPRDDDGAEHKHARPLQLLPSSAGSIASLDQLSSDLARRVAEGNDQDLGDVAYTLQVGRRSFARRGFVVAGGSIEAASALASRETTGAPPADSAAPPVVFMFSGQGSQHPFMTRELYEREPVFRRRLDACADILRPLVGRDLRGVLYPRGAREETDAAEALKQTELAQPALFAVEYALAELWQHWGVRPRALVGHSLGEYVCACLAGVLELEAALSLVAARGRLMQSAPRGAMLAVTLGPAALEEYLADGVEIAAVNAPDRCAVAGPPEAIRALGERLRAAGVGAHALNVSHAFHSASMETISERFAAELRRHELRAPRLPYVSNLTGDWIRAEEARDPSYYLRHLRRPVRFAPGVERLLEDEPRAILLEIGPGQALTNAARRTAPRATLCLPSLPPAGEGDEYRVLLSSLGGLWRAGCDVDWQSFAEPGRRRVALPGYPFERKRHWIEPPDASDQTPRVQPACKNNNVDAWFYQPSWTRSPLAPRAETHAHFVRANQSQAKESRAAGDDVWLVLEDRRGVGAALASHLRETGRRVVTVTQDRAYAQTGPHSYGLRAGEPLDFESLVEDLTRARLVPRHVAHLWPVTGVVGDDDDNARGSDSSTPTDGEAFDEAQRTGFYSLLFLARALASRRPTELIEIGVVSDGVQDVTGDEPLAPSKATMLGAALVLQQEFPLLRCRSIDIAQPRDAADLRPLAERLAAELTAAACERVVALRGRYRWTQTFIPLAPLTADAPARDLLREGGVYLVAGGLGAVGLEIACHLARTARARLVLTGRAPFPEREGWDAWLASHDEGDEVARKIRRLLEAEAHGARVLTLRADVADEDAMRSAVSFAERHFGAINGVIHAAGVEASKTFVAAQELTREDCEAQFRTKARGLLVLERVFRERRPDFFLLCSSLSAVLGGLGFAAYAAANRFLDAAALRAAREGGPAWLSVNFDGWRFDARESSAQSPTETGERAYGITREEGREVFARLFRRTDVGQVVVSTGELQTRIARWVESSGSQTSATKATAAAEKDDAVGTDVETLTHDLYVAPRGELEREVAAVWGRLLGVERIGADDDFFALRGDSLTGVQLVAEINRRFDSRLSLREFFERPTVAGMAEKIGGRTREDEARIRAARPAPDYPLTHAQKRLWILAQNPEASVAYNMCYALRLGGALDAESLRRAFAHVVERHESLRTAFVTAGAEPRQRVCAVELFELPLVDLRGGSDVRAEAARESSAEAHTPFRLDRPPLLRARLLRVADEEHLLLVSLHHIINDGLSLNVLMRELDAAYTALSAGRAPRLAPLAIQYKDFAVWQQEQLGGEAMRAHRDYWLDKLGGELPSLDLPLDRPRPHVQQFGGGQFVTRLPAEQQRALRLFCREQGVTMFMLLAAALKILLHQVTGLHDIVVGSPVAGREQPELEGQIGYYLNNVVLRDTVSRGEPFVALLRRLRATVTEALAHQSYPFDRLVEELAVKIEPGRSPLFDVQLNLMPSETPPLRLGDLDVSAADAPENRTTIFDLNFMFGDGAAGLGVEITYSVALFDEQTIARLGRDLMRLLAAVAERPGSTVRELCELLDGRAAADREAFLASALELTEDF